MVQDAGANLEKQEEKADMILTCSECDRREMLKHFKRLTESKIRVVPHGLPHPFRRPAEAAKVEAVRSHFGLSKPYFLFAVIRSWAAQTASSGFSPLSYCASVRRRSWCSLSSPMRG